jgi:hypothetical protein
MKDQVSKYTTIVVDNIWLSKCPKPEYIDYDNGK